MSDVQTILDGKADPMAAHASRDLYFEVLHADPYGLENKAYDWSGEDKFVKVVAPLAILGVLSVLVLQYMGMAPAISKYTYLLFAIWIGVELIGKLFFSHIVMTYNVKINYVRKLGLRPWRKLKTIVIPLVLVGVLGIEKGGSSSVAAVCMLFCLDILKTMGTEWNVIRRRSKILQRAFICWDRIEDRPYTMRYDILEDIFRFLVYLPFIAIFGKGAILVMIPNLINEFGDGLAEPVGIRFGKHKYRTRSLWYRGKFWAGNFERSYEGSSMVFIVSVISLFMFREMFMPMEFWILLASLPILMTVAEAVSPHTNDGPALAFVGCMTIWLVMYFVPGTPQQATPEASKAIITTEVQLPASTAIVPTS